MARLPRICTLLLLPVLLAVLAPPRALAQDDPGDIPLGDVARNLRKNSSPTLPVIDDDNLTQVMQQAESHEEFGSSLRFLMAGESKRFQVSAPDVTCSLSFTANVKSLLSSSQYSQMDLPPEEMSKLDAKAVIEGDALTVPVFNGTQWHVSELAVALTIVKKSGAGSSTQSSDFPFSDATHGFADPTTLTTENAIQEVRPEKTPDVTVIYRMRTAAPPWTRTVFSAPLNRHLSQDEEWHWAIVQARGYPPQNDPASSQPSAAQAIGESAPPILPAQETPTDPSVLPAEAAQP
jgi:hypothetical protein